MLKALSITCVEIGHSHLVLKMPVTSDHAQPHNILHGGANCVLAESAGSIASNMLIDQEKFATVGLEINATHLRSVSIGDTVIAKCTPIKLGRNIQVWDIVITRESDKKQTCKSRLTTMTIPKK